MTLRISFSDQETIFIDNIAVLSRGANRPKSSSPFLLRIQQLEKQRAKDSRREDENTMYRIIPFVYGCCMVLVVSTLGLTVGSMNLLNARSASNLSLSTAPQTRVSTALLNTVDHSNHRYLLSDPLAMTHASSPVSISRRNRQPNNQGYHTTDELLNRNLNDNGSYTEEKGDLFSSSFQQAKIDSITQLNTSTLQEKTKFHTSNELRGQQSQPRFVASARRTSTNITNYDNLGNSSNVTKEIQLWFSVWFPTYNSENQQDQDSGKALMEQLIDKENPIRQMVLNSFLQLLCQETDMSIVDNPSSSDIDVCASLVAPPSTNSGRRRLRKQQRSPGEKHTRHDDRTLDQNDDAKTTNDNEGQSIYSRSIILNQPIVAIRRRHERNSTASLSNETSSTRSGVPMNISLAWTVWTVTYPVLKIGELYIKETVMTSYTDLFADSLKTMKEVVQLAIDVNLIDAKLDTVMEGKIAEDKSLPPAHASPIRLEWETFLPIYQRLYITKPFVVRSWYSMRVAGLIMLFLSIIVPVTLTYLGNRRRRRLIETEQHHIKLLQTGNAEIICDNNNNNNDEWLTSNQGVEDMLHQSSRFRYTPASDTFVIQGIAGDSEMTSHGVNGTSSQNPQSNVSLPNVGKVALSILAEQSNGQKQYTNTQQPVLLVPPNQNMSLNHHLSQQHQQYTSIAGVNSMGTASVHKTPSPRNAFRITLSSDDDDDDQVSNSGSNISAGGLLATK